MIPPALLQALAGMQGQQQAPSPIDINSIFGGIAQDIESQQAYQEPVPQGPNPFASMGSIFSGTLADMLGARGAQANAQNRLAERQQAPQEAQQRNSLRQAEMLHQKQSQRLQFKEQVAEAKFKVALAANDHEAAEKANNDRLKATADQNKLDRELELKKQEAQLAGNLAVAKEYGSHGKETTPEEKQAKIDADQEKALLKFTSQMDAIRSKPGSTTKGKVKAFAKDTPAGLTPAGLRQIQTQAFSTAKGTKYPGVRDAALSQYIDTLRDATTGEVNVNDPAFKRFMSLFQQLIPTVEERAQFLDSLGIQ